MSARSVITDAAELAQSDIRLLRAEQERMLRFGAVPALGRIPGFGPTPAERAVHLALTTVVALTEHFSAQRLLSRHGVAVNSTTSWPSQEKAWVKYWSLSLNSLPSYLAFRGFNEARNAVMHGLGELTQMQRQPERIKDIKARLEAAQLRVVSSVVVIHRTDFERCAGTCLEFVAELDAATH